MRITTGIARFLLGVVLLTGILLATACAGAAPPVTQLPLATPYPTPTPTPTDTPVPTPTATPEPTPTATPTPRPTATPYPTPTPTPEVWPTPEWPTPTPEPEVVQDWVDHGQDQHPETGKIIRAFTTEATSYSEGQALEYTPTLMVRCDGRPNLFSTGTVSPDGYAIFLLWGGPIGGTDEVLDSYLRWNQQTFDEGLWKRADVAVVALSREEKRGFMDLAFISDELAVQLRDSQGQIYEAAFPIAGLRSLWSENDNICSLSRSY